MDSSDKETRGCLSLGLLKPILQHDWQASHAGTWSAGCRHQSILESSGSKTENCWVLRICIQIPNHHAPTLAAGPKSSVGFSLQPSTPRAVGCCVLGSHASGHNLRGDVLQRDETAVLYPWLCSHFLRTCDVQSAPPSQYLPS